MAEIRRIDHVVQVPDPGALRKIRRKDEDMSEEERRRLDIKKRRRAKKDPPADGKGDEPGAASDVDIRV